MKILAGAKVVLLKNSLNLVDEKTHQDLTIKVDGAEQLDRILKKLNAIPEVTAIRRKEMVNN